MIAHLVAALVLGLGVPDSTDVVVYEDNVLEQAVVVAGRGRMDRLCARGGRVPGLVLPRGEYLVTFTLESAAPSDVTEGKGMYFTAFAGRRMERGSAGEEFVEKGMNPGIFLEGEKL